MFLFCLNYFLLPENWTLFLVLYVLNIDELDAIIE